MAEPRKTLKITVPKLAAFLCGAFLIFAFLSGISQWPSPTNVEAVGIDFVKLLLLVVGIYLLLYAFGVQIARRNRSSP